MGKAPPTALEVAGREVVITNPDKVFFPEAGHTKLDLVKYYAAVAEGALRGIAGRPIVLKRYVDGADGRAVLPEARPRAAPRVDRDGGAALSVGPDGAGDRRARRGAAPLDRQPRVHRPEPAPGARRRPRASRRAARRSRPRPGRELGRRAAGDAARARRARRARARAAGPRPRDRAACTSTCASSGAGASTRCGARRWPLAREVERRAPELATSKWWKEERHGVFLDYNQNAKDRTVASAWSVRPTPDARVSMPLEWDEVAGCDPAAFTLATAPARLAERGDAAAGIDAAAGSLDGLLELSAAQEAAGLGDAPWPPHYKKQRDEPPRVAPSRRKAAGARHERPRPPAVDPAAHHRREGGAQGRTRSPASSAGRRGIRRRRRGCKWTTSSSTRCAAAPPPGRASGSICATFPRASARPRSRPIPTTIPGATRGRAAARSRAPKTRSSS